MNKTFRFPSVLHPESTGYTFHTDGMELWDACYRAVGAVWLHAGKFATLGDGMTQHANEIPVTREQFHDYLASCAAFLTTAELTDVDRAAIFSAWPSDVSREEIEFALSVKYRESGKRLYFSTSERKVSASDGKRNDRRWEPVTEFNDGSINSALGILLKGSTRYLLEVYHLREQVLDVATMEEDRANEVSSAVALKIIDPERVSGRENEVVVAQAYGACASAIGAFRAMFNAKRQVESYRRNTENPKTEAKADG
jgi:hypothetical protein